MAKPSPDALQDAGERLLGEWGIGRDATVGELSAVVHREGAADVAIAHRLGAHASAESVALLQRLEQESADKRVRKEAKRALYRLEQRGVHAPEVEAPAAPSPALAPALEGYLSAGDGRGDQLVWLLKAQPGGVAHLFAVINDPEGLREAALNPVTRKALKSLRQSLEQRHHLRLVEVDWRYADFLMHRAFEWARQRGTRMTGDYPALRLQLTRLPAAQSMPPIALQRLGPAAPADEADQLAQSAGVLEEPELRTWFRTADELKPFLEELASVKDSPLVLNQMQQQERFEDVIGRAIDTIFGGDTRPSWARRLYEMANYFALTRRLNRAAQAVAVARALAGAAAPRAIPFCAHLVRVSLAFFFQQAVEEQEEQSKTSLVLTPQQLMARRERF
jgi:hypothetical protein